MQEKRESNAGDFGGRAVRAVQFRVFLDSDTLTHFPHRAPTDFAPSARHSDASWRITHSFTHRNYQIAAPILPVILSCTDTDVAHGHPHSRSVRRISPCRFTLTLSLTSSAACAATEGGMAHAHAHARQPQIAPSCHVRARTKTAHDTIPIRRVCQCRGKESTSSSAQPPLGTSSSAPPPQPLLLSPSSSAPPPNASTHRQLKRSCLPASQPRHLFSLLKWLRTVDLRLRTPHS